MTPSTQQIILGNGNIISTDNTSLYLNGVAIGGGNTGQLTGAFYPLSTNPNNYINSSQTGNFISNSQTGNFLTYNNTGVIDFLESTGSLTVLSSIKSGSLAGAGWVKVQGRYAYVTADSTAEGYGAASDTLTIFDIHNPASPTFCGQISTAATKGAEGFTIAGNYAYVCGFSSNTISVIDISNSSSPIQVGYASGNGLISPEAIDVVGKYAYVVGDGGLHGSGYFYTIDITNPYNPTTVAALYDNTNLGGAIHVYVNGKYAYVAASNAKKLTVVDISNPYIPVVKGSSPTINIQGSMAPIDGGKYAYISETTGIAIVDISNPTGTLPIVGNISFGTDSAWVLTSTQNYLYIGDIGHNTIRVVDVTIPASPKLINVLTDAINLFNVDDIRLCGNKLLTTLNETVGAGGAGFTILQPNGVQMPTATIGDLDLTNLNVSSNTVLGRNLTIGGGVIVGKGGLYSQGELTSYGNGNFFSGINVVSGNGIIQGNQIVTSNQTGVFLTSGNISTSTGIILGTNGINLTINTFFGQQFNSGLMLNTIMTSANTYYTAISGNIGPGTWMIFASVNVQSPSATAMRVTSKLWSGVGAFFAVESTIPSEGTALTGLVSLSLDGIITTTASSTPLALACASTAASCYMVSAPKDNLTAGIPSGVSTYINAIRLY